jgi:hypothetical protein
VFRMMPREELVRPQHRRMAIPRWSLALDRARTSWSLQDAKRSLRTLLKRTMVPRCEKTVQAQLKWC